MTEYNSDDWEDYFNEWVPSINANGYDDDACTVLGSLIDWRVTDANHGYGPGVEFPLDRNGKYLMSDYTPGQWAALEAAALLYGMALDLTVYYSYDDVDDYLGAVLPEIEEELNDYEKEECAEEFGGDFDQWRSHEWTNRAAVASELLWRWGREAREVALQKADEIKALARD